MRKTTIPPQPSVKRHTLRLIVGTAVAVVVMLLLLQLAVKYLERDWQIKQQRARSSRPRPVPAAETLVAEPKPEGWTYSLPPGATDRHLRRLISDRWIGNWWLVMGRGLPDREYHTLVIASLRLAMAVGGESAAMKNDFGAAYLQQRRMRQAVVQFRAANQIEPGYPPALFNLALGAIADREPAKASLLLGQYLARRPNDIAAYRLQSTLLTQLGRPQEALQMLEKFLKDQPPEQPLFLEAAMLAARLGQHGNAIRYLETSLHGNPIQSVVRAYQSPSFRTIRLSSDGAPLAERLARRARVAFGAPLPVQEIPPLRDSPPPSAIVR